jgi:hypothetical protein
MYWCCCCFFCRQWAFWKGEVRAMIGGACKAWLRDYRMDGLRFDSIKDVPMDMVQVRVVTLLLCLSRERYLGLCGGVFARLPHGWPALRQHHRLHIDI